MANSIAELDLTKTLFGRSRSKFVVFEEDNADRDERRPREGKTPRQEYPVQKTDPNDIDFPQGLYFAMCAQGGAAPRRRGLLDLTPIYGGAPINFRYTATPSQLCIETAKGTVRLVMDTAKTMRVKGKGVGLSLYVEPPFLSMMNALEHPSGVVECNLRSVYPGGGVFFFKALKGEVKLDTKFDPALNGPAYIKMEFVQDGNGEFEVAVYSNNPDEWGYIDYKPFDECAAGAGAEFETFLGRTRKAGAEYKELAELAAHAIWIHYQQKSSTPIMPTLKSDMIYADIMREGQAKAFEQPLYSMAFSDAEAAIELISNNLAHMQNGMMPAAISDTMPCFKAFPPTFGAALLQMLVSCEDKLSKDTLRGLYLPLAEHFDWWVKSHSLSPGKMSYNARGEYAFNSASYGVLPFPLETPDLYAYIITFADALYRLADTLGDGRKEEWARYADSFTGTLLTLWDGGGFNCRGAISGAVCKSDSLLTCMPVILGNRLPGDVRAALVETLGAEGAFLGDRGFRSESAQSPYYDAGVPGRGAVDAALQMLITGGLFDAGAASLASAAAKRYIGYMKENGLRDVIASEGAQDMRRPGDEFNAIGGAAMIYLANKLLEAGGNV